MSNPAVLFLCTHNAGRSQMALGPFNAFAGGRSDTPAGRSRRTRSIRLQWPPWPRRASTSRGQQPTRWTDAMGREADVVGTMGSGDTCPYVPGRRYVEWPLADPAGQPLDAVRPVRDEIEARVRQLLGELGVEAVE